MFPRTAPKLGDLDQAATLGAVILGALYSSGLWRRARRGLEKCYTSTLRYLGWSRIQGTGEGHPLAEDTPFQQSTDDEGPRERIPILPLEFINGWHNKKEFLFLPLHYVRDRRSRRINRYWLDKYTI